MEAQITVPGNAAQPSQTEALFHHTIAVQQMVIARSASQRSTMSAISETSHLFTFL